MWVKNSLNLEDICMLLEEKKVKLFQWFPDDQINVNCDKCYVLIKGNNRINMNFS